ncbi:hypothetical protein GCM10007874_45360 [Labrys miyagiensis]|uniref:DUF2384 domain-containing protein n=2 Tax=Labrys miyagiensis TaxID=346912 RepID=A0ABQ6CN09_9HYPH|nr:hypothetical protein GCM10007874_45360 [Labrys miyagiensis]
MELEDFTPNEHDTMRILNALWDELHPADGERPTNWRPSRGQVRKLNLRVIQGLGIKGQEIVRRWLEAEAD